MKTALTILLLTTASLFADPVANPPTPPSGKPGGKMMGNERRMENFLENLPPDVRQRFQSAREKALADPKIKELREKAESSNREFFEAMRNKMQEIDPGLAEIIRSQVGADNKGKGPKGPEDMNRGGKGGPGREGMAALTDEERAKLMSAREKAKADPTVQAARKKMEGASSPEDRRAAGAELRKAMSDAMIKVDPALAPLIDKLGPPPARPGSGGPAGPGGGPGPMGDKMEE